MIEITSKIRNRGPGSTGCGKKGHGDLDGDGVEGTLAAMSLINNKFRKFRATRRVSCNL
jgi:hypothetical protein